jgi:hypothetical protein
MAGWFWYCDVHDTHGNADSEAEAHYVSASHFDFWVLEQDGEGEPCALVLLKVGADGDVV